MLADNDPMKGYYDRVYQGGDPERILYLKSLLWCLCKMRKENVDAFIEYSVRQGYGSEEVLRILLS